MRCIRSTPLPLQALTCCGQTSANSMCYVLALLAVFPDEQEKLYKHIKSVITDDQLPVCHLLLLHIMTNGSLLGVRRHEQTHLCIRVSMAKTVLQQSCLNYSINQFYFGGDANVPRRKSIQHLQTRHLISWP
jgi:hypothetical protein